MNCGVCKQRMWELTEKISCAACDSVFHLSCANVEEQFVQALVESSIKWACGQCVKKKRLNRTGSEALRDVTLPASEQIADLRHFLEKFRNDLTIQINRVSEDQKQLEIDLGKSIETCHQKLDENLSLLRAQGEAVRRQQAYIEELQTENQALKEQIRELASTPTEDEPVQTTLSDTDLQK